jgi:hypothetical protein
MGESATPSLKTKIMSLTFFVALAAGSFLWFGISIVSLFNQLHFHEAIVAFDKGSIYMLGVGVGLLLLIGGGVLQGFLGREPDAAAEKIFKWGMVISLTLMIALPQLVHYWVDHSAKTQKYEVCGEAGYQWLMYRKIYYADSRDSCSRLVQEKAAKIRS